ncbi:MAG: SDR family oxidoreductase [Devosia sp.]|nr:SDR family oxidoreductase [Devosia sp.]
MTFSDDTISLVFGGHSGIGRAVAQALTSRPGRVVAVSRRDGVDIADPASLDGFVATFSYLDHIIVTSGSQAPSGTLDSLDLAQAKAAFDTKFWGTLNVARAVQHKLRPSGTLTFTSGFLARRALPGTMVKATMNAGVETAARILAKELAPRRVNVVSPGLTDTEAYAAMSAEARQAMLERSAANLPVGRVGRPQDLAAAYLFVIDNPFVTGSTVDVEGGALLA